jgi:hypothetical protein
LDEQVAQLGHAMAAKATAQAGARDCRVDELPRDDQQVVGGQQQRRAQLDDDGLLGRRQRRAQGVGTMGFVFGAVAILPLAYRLPGHVVEPRQLRLGQLRFPDFLANQMGRSGIAVQRLGHDYVYAAVD